MKIMMFSYGNFNFNHGSFFYADPLVTNSFLPQASIKTSPIEKLSQEDLMLKLKSIGLPKSKYQPVEVLFKAYYVASNYHHHMKSNEVAALNEEIKFYRSSYSLHKEYIESVSLQTNFISYSMRLSEFQTR